jgi:hypothetical protein
MSTVAITGATGLIGRALTARLTADGHAVRRVTRHPREPGDVGWDPAAGRLDAAALEGVDAVVNLAGASLDARWTERYKAEIRASRVLGTRLLVDTLGTLARRPRVLVSASAVGYYGSRGGELLDERSAPGTGFLADVCREWEDAAAAAERHGIRVVRTRFGLVLSGRGGLLGRMLPPFRLGVGGTLGSGRAWMSCVGLDDLVDALRYAIATETLRGPANITSPEPVTNAEFTRALGRVLHRPAVMTVPAFALRLLLGGQQAEEMALASLRVVPRVLLDVGYAFRHSTVEQALRAALADAA